MCLCGYVTILAVCVVECHGHVDLSWCVKCKCCYVGVCGLGSVEVWVYMSTKMFKLRP